jgi:hypothetical protein
LRQSANGREKDEPDFSFIHQSLWAKTDVFHVFFIFFNSKLSHSSSSFSVVRFLFFAGRRSRHGQLRHHLIKRQQPRRNGEPTINLREMA